MLLPNDECDNNSNRLFLITKFFPRSAIAFPKWGKRKKLDGKERRKNGLGIS